MTTFTKRVALAAAVFIVGTGLAAAGPVTIKAPILVDAPKPHITLDIRLLPYPQDESGSCCYDPPSPTGSDEPSEEPGGSDEPSEEPGGDSDGNPLTP